MKYMPENILALCRVCHRWMHDNPIKQKSGRNRRFRAKFRDSCEIPQGASVKYTSILKKKKRN